MGWNKARKELGLDRAESVRVTGEGLGQLMDGMPMAEYAQASLQPCNGCGRDPRETGGGRGVNMRIVEGVIVMDTICVDCLDPDEREEVLDDMKEGLGDGS